MSSFSRVIFCCIIFIGLIGVYVDCSTMNTSQSSHEDPLNYFENFLKAGFQRMKLFLKDCFLFIQVQYDLLQADFPKVKRFINECFLFIQVQFDTFNDKFSSIFKQNLMGILNIAFSTIQSIQNLFKEYLLSVHYETKHGFQQGWKDILNVLFFAVMSFSIGTILRWTLLKFIAKKLYTKKKAMEEFYDLIENLLFSLVSAAVSLPSVFLLFQGRQSEEMYSWEVFFNEHFAFSTKLFFLLEMGFSLRFVLKTYYGKRKNFRQAICHFIIIVLTYLLGFLSLGIIYFQVHTFADILSHFISLCQICVKVQMPVLEAARSFYALLFRLLYLTIVVTVFINYFIYMRDVNFSRFPSTNIYLIITLVAMVVTIDLPVILKERLNFIEVSKKWLKSKRNGREGRVAKYLKKRKSKLN